MQAGSRAHTDSSRGLEVKNEWSFSSRTQRSATVSFTEQHRALTCVHVNCCLGRAMTAETPGSLLMSSFCAKAASLRSVSMATNCELWVLVQTGHDMNRSIVMGSKLVQNSMDCHGKQVLLLFLSPAPYSRVRF
jgi:hypothetical protein